MATESRRKNNVQVGSQRSKFVYADLTKHLLNGGEPEVELSALGFCVSDCVAVAEMLKNQGMVTVKRIETSRATDSNVRRHNTDKISIIVVKAPGFATKYAEQQKQREARKAEDEAAKPKEAAKK